MRSFHMTTYAAVFPASELRDGWPINDANGLPSDVALLYAPVTYGVGSVLAAVRRYVPWGLPAWMKVTEQGSRPYVMHGGSFTAWIELVDMADPSCYYDHDEAVRLSLFRQECGAEVGSVGA